MAMKGLSERVRVVHQGAELQQHDTEHDAPPTLLWCQTR